MRFKSKMSSISSLETDTGLEDLNEFTSDVGKIIEDKYNN